MLKRKVIQCSLFGLSIALSSSCGKKDKSEEAGGAKKEDVLEAKKKLAAADPSVWKDLEIPDLGLMISVPGNGKVSSTGSVSTADWKCSLSVFEKSSSSPTHENMVKNIEKGNKGGALKEMVKNEKTDEDNWSVHWTTETGKFGYAAHRKVGDKVVTCTEFQATEKEKYDCAVKVCESIRAK